MDLTPIGKDEQRVSQTLHFDRLQAMIRSPLVPEGSALYSRLYRAKVPGGWLIVADQCDGAGLTFLPDPEHTWNGGSLP
jgi:hypothetical protein